MLKNIADADRDEQIEIFIKNNGMMLTHGVFMGRHMYCLADRFGRVYVRGDDIDDLFTNAKREMERRQGIL